MAKGYKVANLGIEITSSAQGAVKALNSLTDAIKRANTASNSLHDKFVKLGTVSTALNGVNTSINKIGSGFGKAASDTDKHTKQIRNSVQAMSGTISGFGRTLMFSMGFGSVQQGIFTLINTAKAGFLAASDFVENYNLFNVSFGANVKEALYFQNKMNSALGTSISETLRYQGFFNNLAGSLGITNDASALLSENLTKLTYDLSSLFNMPIDLMYSKLQSGIIGQTKPLRSVGIDVTQQTLQPILYEIGIDKLVTELTQAEKVLLRYISILRQSGNAQGDWARTIETPANQLKILKNQVEELTRWFGTTFMGVLGSILPYINAVVMSLKEIFKWISLLMGFDLSDYNFLGETDLPDIESDLDGATQAAEEFKKSLYGFDELNLAGSLDTDGYNPMNTLGLSDTYYKLLDEMKEYDNLMDGVRMKATAIKDAILNWIGFTVDANGAINGINENLVRTKVLLGLLALPALLKVVGGIAGFFNGIKLAPLLKVPTMFASIVALGDKILLFFGVMTGSATLAGLVGFGAVVAGIAASVWLVYEAFQPAIKEADIFGKRVSELTQSKVKPFIEAMDSLDNKIKEIDWSGKIVSNEDLNDIKSRLSEVTRRILDELDADRNQALKNLDPLKYMMTEEEFSEILARSQKYYDEQTLKIQNGQDRIVAIYEQASKENRELTEEERKEIGRIRNGMKDDGIRALSETEKEYAIIMGRIKDNSVQISKAQSLEILSEAIKTKNETIQAAHDQYYGIEAEAQKMLDVGIINKEEYDKIVGAAQTTREDTIKEAEDQYKGILEAVQVNFPKITSFIDTENGKIKTKWDMFWSQFKVPFISAFNDMVDKATELFNLLGKIAGAKVGDIGTIKPNYVPNPTYNPYGTNPPPPPTGKTYHYMSSTGTKAEMEALKKADLNRATSVSQAASISQRQISYYANGGLPATGEMFVARENGIPEMVGKFGSSSGVANNQQIVEGIKQGVKEAIMETSQNNGGDSNIILQVDELQLGIANIRAINKAGRLNNLVVTAI